MPPSTSQNDFIWKAMNLWYYWQTEVADLADNRFSSHTEYQNFLNNYAPNELFYNLLYDYGTTDRFSWIVNDYRTLQNQFAGINKTFGMDFGLVIQNNSDNLIGYVQYVLPNSPAANAGLKRGDIFNRVNGTQLTTSNYQSLLSNETLTLTLAYFENGTLIETNQQLSLTKVEMQENPIYLTKVIEMGGQKIGYLVYNGFRANYNDELNQAMIQLKSQGIQHLILDLRYNGGGSVQTATYLASMLTGQFNGQNFTHLKFNSKTSQNNSTYKFEQIAKQYDDNLNHIGNFPMENLNLNRITILTTGNSASASEMLVICLEPYIQVETIGTKTYGKTVGSITLYDSHSTYYTSDENINPNHKIAMQPIVFEYKNAQNQSGPTFGIHPVIEVNEIHYLENLPELGDINEPLLGAALNNILGPIAPKKTISTSQFKQISSSQLLERFGTEMYLDKGVDLKP
jgi:carboxyl-terminal processing protease